jgi:uncharacterized protein (DUF4415 family)
MKARRTGSRRSSVIRSATRARRSSESKSREPRSGETKAKPRVMTKPDFQSMKITDLYRPLKKPITVRIDADVLAWFKKDGRRYQTRINSALRKVMEREMKSSG